MEIRGEGRFENQMTKGSKITLHKVVSLYGRGIITCLSSGNIELREVRDATQKPKQIENNYRKSNKKDYFWFILVGRLK